jgi:hypothetical protein
MQYTKSRRRVHLIFEGWLVYLGGFETSFTSTHVPVVHSTVTNKKNQTQNITAAPTS